MTVQISTVQISIGGTSRDETAAEETARLAAQAAFNAVTTNHVNQMRNAKINEPKSVSLTSGKVFSADMAGGGRENIGQLGTAALAKASISDTSTIEFRDAANTDWDLTNTDLIEMGLQIMVSVSAIHSAAKSIKDRIIGGEVITDLAGDADWP